MGLHFSKPIVNLTEKSSSSGSSSNKSSKAVVPVAVERYSQVANQHIDATCDTTINEQNKGNRTHKSTSAISIPPLVAPTINLQIEESPTNPACSVVGDSVRELSNSGSSSSSGSLSSARRNIIIKIQLAKMENGNSDSKLLHVGGGDDDGVDVLQSTTASDLNANERFLNVTTAAAACTQRTAGSSTEAAPKISAGTLTSALAAPASTSTSAFVINNNLNGNDVNSATSSLAKLQLNDDAALRAETPANDNDDIDDQDDIVALSQQQQQQERRECERMQENDSAVVEYCEVLEPSSVDEMFLNGANRRAQSNAAAAYVEVNSVKGDCHNSSLSKSALASDNTTTATTSQTTKKRSTKWKCREALRGLRGMLESSTSSSSAATSKKNKEGASTHCKERTKERKVCKTEHRHSTPAMSLAMASASDTRQQHQQQRQLQQRMRNSIAQIPNTASSTAAGASSSAAAAAITTATNGQNQLSIWAPSDGNVGDVIIHIRTPQFLVSQCANRAPLVTVGRINEAPAISVMAAPPSSVSGANNVAPQQQHHHQQQQALTSNPLIRCNQTRVPIIHSQIDFVHYLVPDLERIANSSFYWGKMDRYEAERLLEGMPEGTFLLRDSAQEEFLFSVTFRKYERSLHARIEQNGHKFSFDCHDPCVFTAPTVTGLLEHYKDPSCVMFFEPMLTIPLHRKNPFSLQQLCRATIVSNTSYDGINQLELPARLKSYLKEYHYKQKLRVKPFDADEPFYSCT